MIIMSKREREGGGGGVIHTRPCPKGWIKKLSGARKIYIIGLRALSSLSANSVFDLRTYNQKK